MSVEIIAEVAQGYEGDATLARLLARAAVRGGADAVQFQLIYADEVSTPDYKYHKFYRGLEMPRDVWQRVAKEVKDAGSRFYLVVCGERSFREAVDLGADGVKIHTTDFFNAPLVRSALDGMPRVFISIGGITADELAEFLAVHRISPSQQVCFMYGFQAEPTPVEFNHLLRLRTLQERFPGYRFGFMDHAEGNSDDAQILPLLALPLGIACIEKHITLDRILQIEDYISALSPEDFRTFVQRTRRLEKALGTGGLDLIPLEWEYRHKAMKVVVANRKIRKGESVTVEDLCLKRPGNLISTSSIYRIEQVVGRRASVDIEPHRQITGELLL